MVLGELLLSRFRWREAGFAGSSAAQVGLVGPVVNIWSNRLRFVTICLGLHFMSLITIACTKRSDDDGHHYLFFFLDSVEDHGGLLFVTCIIPSNMIDIESVWIQ